MAQSKELAKAIVTTWVVILVASALLCVAINHIIDFDELDRQELFNEIDI